MAYGDLKVRNLIWNTGSGDNTIVTNTLVTSGANTFTGNQSLGDSLKVQLGAGNDLQIYHSGDVSRIRNTNDSGTLKIQATSNGENAINIVPNGTVELYYDGVKKLETASYGVAITGHCDVNGGDVVIEDSRKIRCGNGDDLQIYHDGGTANVISAKAGDYLYIYSDNLRLNSKTGTEKYVTGAVNGAVELYYDNVKKFETSSTGVSFGDGWLYANDNAQIRLGNGADLQIYHDGSNSYILDDGTGDLIIKTTSGAIRPRTDQFTVKSADNSETIFYGDANSACAFYYDNAKKFETTSSGSTLSGDLLLDSASAEINLKSGVGTESGAINWTFNTASTNYGRISLPYDTRATLGLIIHSGYPITLTGGNSNETLAKFTQNGSNELYYDNAKKLETKSWGAYVYGDLNLSGGDLFMNNGDGHKIQMGAANDLQIFHDGSHNYIVGSTGDIILKNSSANYFKGVTSTGAVELYYDNAKKFETKSNGVEVDNRITVSNGSGTGMLFADGGSTKVGSTTNHRLDLISNNQQIASLAKDGSHGYLSVNTTSILGSSVLGVNTNGTCAVCTNVGATNTQNHIRFVNPNGISGSITTNSNSTSYNTSSDYRLKENEVAISDGITRLKTLKPYRFNFKTDSSTTVDGFFAHEVTAVPEAITGEKDGTEMQGIDQSKLVPLLTAALQEAITKIETLETKVAALEA